MVYLCTMVDEFVLIFHRKDEGSVSSMTSPMSAMVTDFRFSD